MHVLIQLLRLNRIISAAILLYQSCAFSYSFLADLRRGQNGISEGLAFLSIGLALLSLLNLVEATYEVNAID